MSGKCDKTAGKKRKLTCVLHFDSDDDVTCDIDFTPFSKVKISINEKLEELKMMRDLRMQQPLCPRMKKICKEIPEKIDKDEMDWKGFHNKCHQRFMDNSLPNEHPITSTSISASFQPICNQCEPRDVKNTLKLSLTEQSKMPRFIKIADKFTNSTAKVSDFCIESNPFSFFTNLTTAQDSAFKVVINFVQDSIIGNKQVSSVSVLEEIYSNKLKAIGHPEQFRRDQLKSRLQNHSSYDNLEFTKVTKRGQLNVDLVYSSYITKQEAVTNAYKTGSKFYLEDAALQLHNRIKIVFKEFTATTQWEPVFSTSKGISTPTSLLTFINQIVTGSSTKTSITPQFKIDTICQDICRAAIEEFGSKSFPHEEVISTKKNQNCDVIKQSVLDLLFEDFDGEATTSEDSFFIFDASVIMESNKVEKNKAEDLSLEIFRKICKKKSFAFLSGVQKSEDTESFSKRIFKVWSSNSILTELKQTKMVLFVIGDATYTIYEENNQVKTKLIPELKTTHTLSATKVINLIKYVEKIGFNLVVINSYDDDLIFNLIYHCDDFKLKVFLDFVMSNKPQCFNLSEFAKFKTQDFCSAILGAHIFMNDFKSVVNKPKQEIMRKLLYNPKFQSTFRELGKNFDINKELMIELEAFICVLFNNPQETSIEALIKKNEFTNQNINLFSTKKQFISNILNVNRNLMIYKNSLDNFFIIKESISD